MKKIVTSVSTFSFLLLTYLFVALPAKAVCPVCTIAVGAGLGLSRYFGIDDSLSGIWVGGLILSTALWTADWLHKRGLKIKIRVINIISVIAFYALTIIPLYYSGIIGHPYNTIYGMDKLLFGTIIGSLVFILGINLDKLARKKYGRQFFVYQKVVFPVVSLITVTLILYLAINK
ncbi:MAG: hypothetical protein PHQ59_00505 [Candidatus Daviesbacteria bacterium]|nr:hypothetical protein [Candidatus Daviesbacteria bacterium]